MHELTDRERLIKSMLLREIGIKGDFDERLEAQVDSQAVASKVGQTKWVLAGWAILGTAFVGYVAYYLGLESPFMTVMAAFILGEFAGEAKRELGKRKLIQSLLQKYENDVDEN
ncbi:MAG: hypothetical protein QGH25_04195 [Candidatus Latescibacteria bacterium]|nr:hypothetical protein [Candidatus Latescibacterota bacterium]